MKFIKAFFFTTVLTTFSLLSFAQDSLQALPLINTKWRVYPVIASSPQTSWMFGLGAIKVFGNQDSLQNNLDKISTFTPVFVYTLRNQFILYSSIDYFTPNGWNMNGSLKWAYFPNLFFGVGSYADEKSESFTGREYRLKSSFRKSLHPKLYVGAIVNARYDEINNFEKDLVLDTSYVHGENGGFLWGAGPAVTFDSRDNSAYPMKGFHIDMDATFHPKALGNDYHFNRYSINARKYLTIGKKKQNVLALQAFFAYSSGNDVPFYIMDELSDDDRLRGFHSQRYIDKGISYVQAEYRFVVWEFIGMTTFAGVGDVFNDNWDFSNPKYSGGLGLRLRLIPKAKINVRLDYAIGTDLQDGFYFGLKEAF